MRPDFGPKLALLRRGSVRQLGIGTLDLEQAHERRHLPDFESFAREQVKAGAFASEEAIVAYALQSWLTDSRELKAMVGAGLASVDRGEGLIVKLLSTT